MQIRTYEVELTGQTPMIMHQDNLPWSDYMTEWRKNGENKKISKAGDDRTPAWTWIGCLYVDNEVISVPSDNLMKVLQEGGKLVPTGKGKQTFKAISQSGIVTNEISWPLLIDGNPVPFGPINALVDNPDYRHHEQVANSMGFFLFAKRVAIGPKKHVRVRPRFDRWTTKGTLSVLEERITTEVLVEILAMAGKYSGLCDWRVSAPYSPGHYGKFTSTVKLVS